jgi:apolipoprotein N-acyltransferase
MNGSKRSGLESLSVGYLIIAFAVSVLLAYSFEDWWLLIPFFLIAAGVFYLVLGFFTRPAENQTRKALRDSNYYIFWGGTVGLFGLIWLLNRQFPNNVVPLFVLFVLWIGGIVLVLSLPRLRGSGSTPQQ